MAEHGLGHALSLLLGRAQPPEHVEREDAAGELEREQRGADARVHGPDVMEHAGQEVGLEEGGRGPAGEGVHEDGSPVVEDPHRVVIRLDGELALCAVLYLRCEGAGGVGDGAEREGACWSGGGVRSWGEGEEGICFAGDRCPPIGFDCGVGHCWNIL